MSLCVICVGTRLLAVFGVLLLLFGPNPGRAEDVRSESLRLLQERIKRLEQELKASKDLRATIQKQPSAAKAGSTEPERRQRTGAPSAGEKIVNGIPTNAFPAAGALLRGSDPATAKSHCSGTLVGCNTFLTAAHCVEEDTDAKNYVVFFQHGGFYEIENIQWPTKEYVFPTADIAVLTLRRSVERIEPMAIEQQGAPTAGTEAFVIGFGRTAGDRRDSGIKRLGRVMMSSCRGTDNGKPGGQPLSDEHSICWNFDGPIGAAGEDSNTCKGDSGGGLHLISDLTVAGVTSGGQQANCLKGDHGFDTNVFRYSRFVEESAAGNLGTTTCGTGAPIDLRRHVQGGSNRLGAKQVEKVYPLAVPAGLAVLRVTMNSETQVDFDLYVGKGDRASAATALCIQAGDGNFAACEIEAPAAGAWWVLIKRKRGDGQFQWNATYLSR